MSRENETQLLVHILTRLASLQKDIIDAIGALDTPTDVPSVAPKQPEKEPVEEKVSTPPKSEEEAVYTPTQQQPSTLSEAQKSSPQYLAGLFHKTFIDGDENIQKFNYSMSEKFMIRWLESLGIHVSIRSNKQKQLLRDIAGQLHHPKSSKISIVKDNKSIRYIGVAFLPTKKDGKTVYSHSTLFLDEYYPACDPNYKNHSASRITQEENIVALGKKFYSTFLKEPEVEQKGWMCSRSFVKIFIQKYWSPNTEFVGLSTFKKPSVHAFVNYVPTFRTHSATRDLMSPLQTKSGTIIVGDGLEEIHKKKQSTRNKIILDDKFPVEDWAQPE